MTRPACADAAEEAALLLLLPFDEEVLVAVIALLLLPELLLLSLGVEDAEAAELDRMSPVRMRAFLMVPSVSRHLHAWLAASTGLVAPAAAGSGGGGA